MVEPCRKSCVCSSCSSSVSPIEGSADRIELITPSAKFGGVERDFPIYGGWPSVTIRVSVHVPPTSLAMMYRRLTSLFIAFQPVEIWSAGQLDFGRLQAEREFSLVRRPFLFRWRDRSLRGVRFD